MEEIKGWICLDIDGTVTSDPHRIPDSVICYFLSLHQKGWRFVFITGRTFTFAHKVLSSIPFSYYFAVQNGTDVFLMPERKLLYQRYLNFDIIEHLNNLYGDMKEDYLIYSGWQKGDFCYYRPKRFSSDMMKHLELMMGLVEEPWQALTSFDSLKRSSFPLIKCLGSQEHMKEIDGFMKDISQVNSCFIKDPLSSEGYYINLITAKGASKGDVVSFMRTLARPDHLFIGAGDDRNDISLLKAVDRAIAMENGPEDLKALAHIIAPPAEVNGIIKALEEALTS